MTAYARSLGPVRTLTKREVALILKVTAEARGGLRDHTIISVGLGTGLRESEILALDYADVAQPSGKPKRIIALRKFKRSEIDGEDPALQRVHVPDATLYKLEKYLRAERKRFALKGHRPKPLFVSNRGTRLSDRQLRTMFRRWQERARFEQLYPFHALRHTAISAVRERTGDIRIAQLFARHKNITTTTRYDHPSSEEMAAAVKGQVA